MGDAMRRRDAPAGKRRPRPAERVSRPSSSASDLTWLTRHAGNAAVCRALAGGANGLPVAMRARAERLSGVDMSDVSVHLRSPEPSRFGADAYALGSQIHLAPGQERHLPHEAWHVVQQKRAYVRPTGQIGGQPVNSDAGLEAEADRMGALLGTSGTAGTAIAARPTEARPRTPRQPVLQPRFSQSETALLMLYPQVSTDAGALVTLQTQTTRSGRDLAQLLAINHPASPSVADIVALDRFTNRQIFDLLHAPAGGSWQRLVTLAALQHTADDIVYVATLEDPTFPQLYDVLRAFTYDEFAKLTRSGAGDWASLAALAANVLNAGSLTQVLLGISTSWQVALQDDLAALAQLNVHLDPVRYEAALIGTNSLDVGHWQTTLDYLNDARYFSICFDTASRLLALAGTGVVAYASGGATNATYALAQQQQRMLQLTQDIAAAAGVAGGVMFNVHVGGHGFTLTVLGQTVFQLEAFASRAGTPFAGHADLSASLYQSIRANKSYPLATVCGHLTGMASAQAATRATAAGAMGWSAGPCGFVNGPAIVDPMVVWWSASNLATKKDVVLRLSREIQRRRKELFRLLGGQRPEE
jgi:hypothetical protein